jgi:transforming growth factor-beta-induced protein
MNRMVCVQICVLALVSLSVLCGTVAAQEPAGNTVVECAAAEGNVTTLVSLLERTGLNETLSNETQTYTVFAPTDDAFAQLSPDVSDLLLNSTESEVLLPEVLLYHVIEGAYNASDLVEIGVIETVQGENLVFTGTADNLTVNDVNVTVADIQCGNGVLHVIDGVLLPSFIPTAGGGNVTTGDGQTANQSSV